jgi:cytochrome b involved in lipid metabolism
VADPRRSLVESNMSEVKTYTWDELKAPEAADKKGILMLISGKVYAISKFLDEVSSPTDSPSASGWVGQVS